MVATLDVLFLPEPCRRADCLVVVDLLRATTTIPTLFERGLVKLTVAADIEYARRLRDETGAVLFGEVGGLPPEDFDHGNSPVEASGLDLAGRSGVMFTSNGTGALCLAAQHGRTIAGSLANVSAVAAAVRAYDSVLVVCAGNAGGTTFSLEDAYGAAEIAQHVAGVAPGLVAGDAGRLLLASDPVKLRSSARGSGHARLLEELDLSKDVVFAFRPNSSRAVPTVTSHGDGWAVLEDLRGE
ncbi:MAG: 2-phosphosulfolactate phosphatase [Dehalococcoidia bacterium]